MHKTYRTLVVGLFALIAGTSSAMAAGEGGCGAFEWPLDKELGWMADANAKDASSGGKLEAPPENAIVLKLAPQASVVFPLPPGGKPKGDPKEMFGGVLTFDGVPKPGIYQVTLSSVGWVDLVQNGAALSTTGHTGMKDCAAIRKSVRFKIGEGPFALQLSGIPQGTIKIAVRAAE
jgi:hypothetical protein